MSIIAAGTTTTTALSSTGNTDGTLQFQVNGTTPSVTLNTLGAVGVGAVPNFGTSGQALVSAGSTAAPTWATIAASQWTTSGSNISYTAGQVQIGTGSAAAPALSTPTDPNTGMFFPAADTIAFAEGGVEAMRLDASGNMGLGVAPSVWSQGKAFEISAAGEGLWGNGLGDIWMMNGAYFNSGWKYSGTTRATAYRQGAGTTDGSHSWHVAPSGTAGNAITFTQAMTLSNSGALGFGNTPSYGTSGQVLTSAGSGAAPTWSTVSAGNMSVFTANGASVPAGNAFLLSSTSSIPSGWSFNGTGNGFTIPAGQSWVGLINSRMFAGVFAAGGMTHNDGGTTQRWMFNSGSLSTASNIDQYLPMIMFRLY